MTMRTFLTYCGVDPDAVFLVLDESVESCITTTLNLFFYTTTPGSVSLFQIQLTNSKFFRTLNELS